MVESQPAARQQRFVPVDAQLHHSTALLRLQNQPAVPQPQALQPGGASADPSPDGIGASAQNGKIGLSPSNAPSQASILRDRTGSRSASD